MPPYTQIKYLTPPQPMAAERRSGRLKVVVPLPPKVVPIKEYKGWLVEICRTRPSHRAQLAGSYLYGKALICPKYGSITITPFNFFQWCSAFQMLTWYLSSLIITRICFPLVKCTFHIFPWFSLRSRKDYPIRNKRSENKHFLAGHKCRLWFFFEKFLPPHP